MKDANGSVRSRESIFTSTATEVATGAAVFLAPAVAVARAVAGSIGHKPAGNRKVRRASVVLQASKGTRAG